MKKWKTLGSSVALGEKWFKVRKDKVELPNGLILDDFFVWESGNVSMVVPVTSEGKFVLVKQYKHGAGEIMIEYPAGYINKSERPLEAAKREVLEETKYELKDIELLVKNIHQPTKEDGVVFIFLANVAAKTLNVVNPDEIEEIELLELTPREILKMIRNGEIWADGTITATFLALDKLGLIEYKLK